jgi:hypothetical protein
MLRQQAMTIPSPVRHRPSTASPASTTGPFRPSIRAAAGGSGAGLLQLLESGRCRAAVAQRLQRLLRSPEGASSSSGEALLGFLQHMGGLIAEASTRWAGGQPHVIM